MANTQRNETALLGGEQAKVMCSKFGVSFATAGIEWEQLRTLSALYKPVHAYLCSGVCVAGCIMNLANVAVLTRKEMKDNAVNVFLTGIACCDFLLMFVSLVFTVHFSLVANGRCEPTDFTAAWAWYSIFYVNASIVCHSSSIWLSVKMAHMRYTMLRCGHQGQMTATTPRRSLCHVGAVICGVALTAIPVMLNYNVFSAPMEEAPSGVCRERLRGAQGLHAQPSIYGPAFSKTAMAHGCLNLRVSYWIVGLLFKMVPCVLLSVYIVLLVCMLQRIHRRRAERLTAEDGKQRAVDNSTRMLIAILLIFLLTELPQGILAMGVALFDGSFRIHVYNNLGEFIDLLSLINSAINFLIYCVMSQQFRDTFSRLFLHSFRKCLRTQQQVSVADGCEGEPPALLSRRLSQPEKFHIHYQSTL